MVTRPIGRDEKSLSRFAEAIAQLQQGRSNAHGSFTLDVTPATTTTVEAPTCGTASNVAVVPNTAHAGNIMRATDFWVVAGSGSFVVHHAATANTDCTFTFAIQG